MIETLNGIHETVNFSNNSTIMLYNNDECEDYPIHWHTPIEIVMPLENTYKAVCNDVSFDLSIGDILLIAPGTLHTLSAPPSGRRLIFQADISLLNSIKECESAISLISPATLITPSNAPQIHDTLYDIMMEILDEYEERMQQIMTNLRPVITNSRSILRSSWKCVTTLISIAQKI